jgi:hypothetical protein
VHLGEPHTSLTPSSDLQGTIFVRGDRKPQTSVHAPVAFGAFETTMVTLPAALPGLPRA